MKDIIVYGLMILASIGGLLSTLCFFVSIPLAFIFEWGIDVLLGSAIGAIVSRGMWVISMMIDEV